MMSRKYAHLWFIGPALFLMFVILILPILIAMGLSFTDYSLGNSGASYVGLKNYDHILTRRVYAKMFGATFRYVLVVVPLSVGLGLGAALMISSLKRFGDFYKTIYFLPVMAALIAMAIIWQLALHPTIGVVNTLLGLGCGTVLEHWGWYAHACDLGAAMAC